MSYAPVDTVGNGVDVLFSFPFEKIQDTDIKVTLDGVAQSNPADFTVTGSQVQFTTPPGVGVAIRIYRETNIDSAEATFYLGSTVRAADLNDNFSQNRFRLQELDGTVIVDDGTRPFVADLDMGGNKVTNVAAPTASTDAATKAYVDANDALQVTKAGDSMSGNLEMAGNKITGLGVPAADTDSATKAYVDTNDALQVTKAGDSMSGNLEMSGNLVTGLGEPSADTDAATKLYVDTRVGASGPPGYTNWSFIASGGETVLGLTGSTLEYQTGKEQLYLNGVLQRRDVDYTATDGRTATMTPALIAGDIVMVRCVNYLAADPTASYDFSRWVYTAVGGETVLSGGSPSLSYTVSREQVFLNGVLLQRGIDYTANNGSSISILGSSLISGDIVEVHSNNSI